MLLYTTQEYILETSDKGSISMNSNDLSPAVSCRREFVRWTNIVAFWDAQTERHSRTFFRSRTKTGERAITPVGVASFFLFRECSMKFLRLDCAHDVSALSSPPP